MPWSPATLQVGSEALDNLAEYEGGVEFKTCEQGPGGDEDDFLVNLLGGIAVDMSGPAGLVCVHKYSQAL